MKKSAEAVKAELTRASTGLLWMSESDYPFEVVEADGSGNIEDAVKSLAGDNRAAQVERRTVDEFFHPAITSHAGETEERRAMTNRYRELMEIINRELDAPAVYRVGSVQVQVYILGRTGDGKLVGLKTTSIET